MSSAQWGGSFDNLSCECSDECSFTNASYAYYNTGGADAARAYSCEDNNKVWLNDANTLLGEINEQEGIEFNLATFDIIYSCEPLEISGEEGTAGIGIYSADYAGTVLATNVSRTGGLDLNIYSLSATSVDIYRNGVLETTLSLTPNTGTIFTKTGNYTGVWTAIADGQILGYRRDDNAGNTDPAPMLVAGNNIVGWASTIAYISSFNGTDIPFTTESHLGTYSGTTGTTYNIVNSVDLPHTTTEDNYYDIYVAINTTTSSGGLTATSLGDSDGGTNTPHIPINMLCDKHIIPQPTEFVSFMKADNTPVLVYDNTGVLIQNVVPTRVNANAWYSARIGTPNGLTNFQAGLKIECGTPCNVVYQPKGGLLFASDDDELVSEGCCQTPIVNTTTTILPTCSNMTTNFFNEQQFAWGFQVQVTNSTAINQWQYVIEDANYQIDPTQVTNNIQFTYSEIDNMDGTWDLIFTSVAGLAGFTSSATYQLNGVNFGFTPTSSNQSLNCN